MAKATAEEAALTRQKIIDTAVSITLEQGFEEATLGNLAKRIGMSRSGITCHFKYKTDIAAAIEPTLIKIIYDYVDFSSCDTFLQSWVEAIKSNATFKSCISSLGPVIPSSIGFDKLVAKIGEEIGRASCRERVYAPV